MKFCKQKEPMEQLARDGQLMCYKHHGFWQCMDTLRDKEELEKLWTENKALWKVWDTVSISDHKWFVI